MLLVQPGDIVKWGCCSGEKILGKRDYNIFYLCERNNSWFFFFFFLGNPTYKGCYYLKQDAILAYSEILRAFS